MENTMGITMAVALLFFLVGLFMLRGQKKRVWECTAQTSGVVSDIERTEKIEKDDNGKEETTYVYYPVYTYTVDGSEISKRASTGSGLKRFKIGQAVTVFYNPANPDQYYVKEDKLSARGGFLIMGIGVLLFVLGIVLPYFE